MAKWVLSGAGALRRILHLDSEVPRISPDSQPPPPLHPGMDERGALGSLAGSSFPNAAVETVEAFLEGEQQDADLAPQP